MAHHLVQVEVMPLTSPIGGKPRTSLPRKGGAFRSSEVFPRPGQRSLQPEPSAACRSLPLVSMSCLQQEVFQLEMFGSRLGEADMPDTTGE